MNRYIQQRFTWVFLALVLGANFLLQARCEDKPANPAAQAAAALYDGIRTETLPNGLKIYLKPIKGAATVTTMVAYKVGSSDEELDSTGLSHYLEHLMFKGTDKIKPGDIDRLTQRNAGQNNAYTTEDITNYHFDFPSDRWEVALEVEADRMRNLKIDKDHEFEEEKGAVIEELHRDEDEPWDIEQKTILPLLFGNKAPYGHPVIGITEHVEGATAKVIKGHYDRWYHPNNASLIIVGGFDPDKAMEKIKKLFGPIPQGKLPERKAVSDEKLKRPVSKEIESKFETPRIMVGFNTVRIGEPDDPVLDVIQGVLTSGKTGRLYKRFVQNDKIANEVSSSNNSGRYPGWFEVQMELIRGKDRAKAERALLEEIEKLGKDPIDAAELARVKQSILTSLVFGRERTHDLADSIARGVSTNDLDYLKNYFAKLQAVSVEDVQRVAKKYLDPEQRVVIWSVPPRASYRGLGGADRTVNGAPLNHVPQGKNAHLLDQGSGGGMGLSLKDAKRVELPNGLVLLLFENHRLPVLVAQAYVKRTHVLEPADKAGVAALTGSLLDEGTRKHTGPEIAELIENVGGTLSMGASGGSVQVLSNNASLGLGLLIECLTQPKFAKEPFERQKTRLQEKVDESEHTPETRAQNEFNHLVYGKHPLGRPSSGLADTIRKLTPEDCATFHSQVFVPNNTLLAIAGDFDSKQMIEEIKRLTADWKKGEVPHPTLGLVEKPAEFTQKIIKMPDAAQLHFYMGHVGVRRNFPEYYKLLVMDYVLGTGTGFTDRLSSNLRDRLGLAYTVSANITNTATEEPGAFTCYIGAKPENFQKVKDLILKELNRIRDEKPKDEEVEDVKQYLLGSQAFKMESASSIVRELLLVERFGLGFDYLDDYRKAVSAVTPADVQAVAKKFLDPKRMFLVATGAIDEKGKPLKMPPR